MRPSVFGPSPDSIYRIVHESLKYRKMAHSAEDITMQILTEAFHIGEEYFSSDIRNGFVLKFPRKPTIDLAHLEEKIRRRSTRNWISRTWTTSIS